MGLKKFKRKMIRLDKKQDSGNKITKTTITKNIDLLSSLPRKFDILDRCKLLQNETIPSDINAIGPYKECKECYFKRVNVCWPFL